MEARMSAEWAFEMKRFAKMDRSQRAAWLAEAIYTLSMAARGTYRAGTDTLADPVMLRAFNELLHRISEQQLIILTDVTVKRPDDVFFEMLSEEADRLGVSKFLFSRLSRR